MDIRIDGLHEDALLEMMTRNGEKTGTAMARILIRDAAIAAGIWPGSEPKEAQPPFASATFRPATTQ